MLRYFRKSNDVATAPAGKSPQLSESAKRAQSEAKNRAARGSQFAFTPIVALICLAFALVALLAPLHSVAWGTGAQRMIVGKAVDTLPTDLRPFFDDNRAFLTLHVTDPTDEEAKTPTEKHNHFIYLDRYGRFPYTTLPRVYKQAVSKYSKSKLEQTGLLPWQIGVYSAKLTTSFQQGRWDEAKLNAAILAGYVAEAHDPFNTTENFDGHLTLQNGVNDRFGTTLVDRFSSFFPIRPNDASFIADPTDHAFEACLSAHSALEIILLADRNALSTAKAYNDEYFDHFYSLSAATLIRQLSDASTDVGSYWLTAWTNAGKPAVPQAQH